MNLAEAILSQLGTKPEPFGWSDLPTALVLFILFAMIAGVELLIGRAVRRIVMRVRRSASSGFDRANRKPRNDR